MADTLKVLPGHFTTKTFIEGLEAGDLFSLNSMLGGSIEIQVVESLNKLRDLWDPTDHWREYRFVRSSQTFPDVRLQTDSPRLIASGAKVVLGVELKGWYLLSKENQPSFRYTVNRAACDLHDLVAVYPWHLTNVLSGYPEVYRPYVESAYDAAVLRDYYWTVERRTADLARPTPPSRAAGYYDIVPPATAATISPYPDPKSKVSDSGKNDSGKNFGRLGRSKLLMADYIEELLHTPVSGIEARHWTAFFKNYADGAQKGTLDQKITKMVTDYAKASGLLSTDIKDLLDAWVALLPETR